MLLKNIAIVTGASSGIGRSFLKLIIKERGIFGGVPFDEVWAIARNSDKLNSVIDSLESASSIHGSPSASLESQAAAADK